jgi:hypothetical protein
MDRTGQLWLFPYNEIILVIGMSDPHPLDHEVLWWDVVIFDEDGHHLCDSFIEYKNKIWENRSSIKRFL